MSEPHSPSTWKRCGVCKRELAFDADYYECSVSTCNTGRNHTVFCSVPCWEQHVPVLRHREAWAEQKRSPSRAEWDAAQLPASSQGAATASSPRRIVVATSGPARKPAPGIPDDVLVVASKLKAYIRARAGMNTSESVMEELSNIIREHADRAIDHARADGRKTVMDRDFRGD